MAASFQLPEARQEKSARVLSGAPPRLVPDWQVSKEARVFTASLFTNKKRRQFGLLESPLSDSPALARLPVHSCKLLLLGKARVGKTSTVQKLAGRPVPKSYQETLGVQTSTIYWPVKLTKPSSLGGGAKKNIAFLQLELWDAAERSAPSLNFEKNFTPLANSVNTVAFLFSYTNRRSWEELPEILLNSQQALERFLKVVIGTRADSSTREVTQKEVTNFQLLHGIRVLSIGNVDGAMLSDDITPDGQAGLADIAPLLNGLTEEVVDHLWMQQNQHREGGDRGEGSGLQD